MTLFKDTIRNYPKAKLPTTLEVDGNAIFGLYSQRDGISRINFGEFIEKSLNIYQQVFSGLSVEIKQCFIERTSLMKINTETRLIHPIIDDDELSETPVHQLIAKRIICKIGAQTSKNAEMIPTLGISLSEKDEQIAFGNDVTICSNFTLFTGKDNLYSANDLMGNKKVYDIDALLKKLMPIFFTSDTRFEIDLANVERLKNIEITKNKWYKFIGRLMEQIHYVNHARENHFIASLPKELKNLPLTQNQLSGILVESVKPAHTVYNWLENETTSAWNVVNWGTEMLKPVYIGNPSHNVLTSHKNWVELVEKKLCNN